EVNMIKAKIALHNKNYDQAIISLRTVTKDDPENIEAYLLLSAAHKQNDEAQQADDVLDQAYDNNRTNVESLRSLAQYYIQTKQISDAEKVIDSLLLINETDEYAMTVKAKLLNARKDYIASEKLALDLVKNYPANPEGYIQSIAPMVENGKVQELKALLEEGYEKTDRSIQLLQTIVAIDSGQKNYDAAISRLQSEILQDDKNAELHRMLAKVYDASGDKEKSSEEFNNAIFIDPELGDSYIELANLYTRTGETERAVKILNDGKNRIPANTKIMFSLAQIYELTADYDKAIGEYEAILAVSSDNLLANNNLAALLSDHKTDDASLKRAKDIADKLKVVKQPVIQDTVGWVYYKSGNYSDAVEVLKQVVAAQPDIQVFNYHLGMAYHKSGDNTEAKKYLEAALASDKDFQGRDDAAATLKSL
ncbi:MAG: tetratricopeptide repeat protein, partial [Gammaproteobacteria bacterium]|nr:tetratricopeptide repeat protein [Gammaproteobacteria bacterium]